MPGLTNEDVLDAVKDAGLRMTERIGWTAPHEKATCSIWAFSDREVLAIHEGLLMSDSLDPLLRPIIEQLAEAVQENATVG